MKRLIPILAVLALTSCSSNPDPHTKTKCSLASGWQIDGNLYTGDCELGCVAGPIDAVDADDNGEDDRCAATVACPIDSVTEIDGLVGCCTAESAAGPFVFEECE